MKELTNAVNNAIAEGSMLMDLNNLRQVAKNWAVFSLDTYTDAFLTKALAVSKAIAEFCTVIEKDNPSE